VTSVKSSILLPPSERLVQILLSEEYRPLIQQYRCTLEDDPDYLRFHCTSTGLKLQYELNHEWPELAIASCESTVGDGACIIDALEDAIRRVPVGRDGHGQSTLNNR
jgi:hypothetical protein